jgi:hypothetical protein
MQQWLDEEVQGGVSNVCVLPGSRYRLLLRWCPLICLMAVWVASASQEKCHAVPRSKIRLFASSVSASSNLPQLVAVRIVSGGMRRGL